MKTKHLLAAMVLPAIFSACSQDELTANMENEVVGTPIGCLEFTASFGDATTRLAPGIGWQTDDKIGMGWISDGSNLPADQASNNLYSNHPLFYTSGKYKSHTMIYEGLYIASFPFQNTTKVSPLEFDLSKQIAKDHAYAYANRFSVSDKFIDLRDDAAGLGNSTNLTMVGLTNMLKLNIKLASGATLPADFKVLGVTLNGGEPSKLVNKLTLDVDDGTNVAKDKSTLAAVCWTEEKGNIEVTVGEDKVGYAIDATTGLTVEIQMGAFANDDATTLKIHTNYGDADIVSTTNSVTWKSEPLNQIALAEVNDFASAIKGAQAKAAAGTKPLGQSIEVNVTLDAASIKANSTISNQEELTAYVETLKVLGQLDKAATITFTKSDLAADEQGVEAEGDVVITDISVLNAITGAITFEKAAAAAEPTHVYVAGNLNLTADMAEAIDMEVMQGQTLTIAGKANFKAKNITVNAGATLVNQTDLKTTGTVTISSEDDDIPAAHYISETGANASNVSNFTNDGEVQWKAGTLKADMTGILKAYVSNTDEMMGASSAFDAVTGAATKEVIITNMVLGRQMGKITIPGIKMITVKGNFSIELAMDKAFDFTALAMINVESGSFSLTGGNSGEGENAFYALGVASKCDLKLAPSTKLNIAAGVKLDLGSGTVSYKNTTVNNQGYITTTGTTSGSGSWEGNLINENPKEVN